MSKATLRAGHVILNTYMDNSMFLEIDRSGFAYTPLSREEALQIADFILVNVERPARDVRYENAVQDMTTNRWGEDADNQIVHWYLLLLDDKSPNAEKFAGDYPLSTGELVSEHAPFSPEARSRIFEVGYVGWRKDHKPWHDAKEGDVWLITAPSGDYPAVFHAGRFRDWGGSWGDSDITAGRRIWLEVQS